MNYQCAILGDISLDRFLLLPETPIIPSPNNPGNFVFNLELGQKIPVSKIYESIGGNAYNIAYGLTLLQIPSALIASVGTDELSQYIVDTITDYHINTDHIHISEESGVNQSTILSLSGERVVLSYHTPKNYNSIQIPEADWLYITSLSHGGELLLQSLITQNIPHRIAFNPGSYLLKNHLDLIHNIISKIEIIFVNKEEAQYIINAPQEESIPNLIQAMQSLGIPIIVITDGNNGAYVCTENNTLYLPSRPVTVAETTGAGDAFAAAFLASFIQSGDISQSLIWGIIQSSAVLREIGSVNGLLSLEELIPLSETLTPQAI
jgi:sugar/nucleoside kinase (ribokinase family)